MLPINIKLNDDFLDEETRCGYVVPAKLKQVWAVELDLLKTFLDVCKAHDIRVQVFAGTLLGAVRHKGFIPWDDDVDVCMDRKNFKKLLALPEGTFKSPYFLQTPFSDKKFYCPFARFRNSQTTGAIRWNWSADYNNGIYIDIFVLDGYIPGFVHRMFRWIGNKILHVIDRKRSKCKSFRSVLGLLRFLVLKFVSYEFLIHIHQAWLSVFTPFSRRLTFMTHPDFLATKYWILKDDLKSTTCIEFETIKVPVPTNYQEVLTRIYGDYMSYPPLDQRGKWHSGQILFNPTIPYKDYLTDHPICDF